MLTKTIKGNLKVEEVIKDEDKIAELEKTKNNIIKNQEIKDQK